MKSTLLQIFTVVILVTGLALVFKSIQDQKASLPNTEEIAQRIAKQKQDQGLEPNTKDTLEAAINNSKANKTAGKVNSHSNSAENSKNSTALFGKKVIKNVKVKPVSPKDADWVWEKMIPNKKYKDDLSGDYQLPTHFKGGKLVKYKNPQEELISELEEVID